MALRISNIAQKFQNVAHKRTNYLIRNFVSIPSLNDNSNSGRASNEGSTINTPSKKIVTPLPPLTEPLKNLPEVVYAKSRPEDNVTQVTTLSNGLRVASEKRFGQFCTVGVVINSGPRYEVGYPSGISHFLEKLAFQSTANFGCRDEILRELERHGGICDCQSSRDTFIYAASVDSRGIESVTKLLGDVTLRPNITEMEMELARQTVKFELESLGMRPEQESILMDMIHAAAYKDNTLGLPKICPEKNIDVINQNILFDYLKYHHIPERMVVAGVGVDHDILVKNVEKYFVNEGANWSGGSAVGPIDKSVAQYTGGIVKEECDIPIYKATGLPELAHFVIGVESCSYDDKDFIVTCILNIMMGGGGSFSAGGPGKGMYTRLYTNVLNRYHWMYSSTAYNHAYRDTGLFCIHASAPPSHVHEMANVIARELVAMASKPGEQELRRAKTQLQSMLLMNLESRPVVFEDIGRQVLATGHRKRPEYFIQEIENVEASDIQRVARRLLSSPPSLAARGNIKDLPPLKYIQSELMKSEGKTPSTKRNFLFR